MQHNIYKEQKTEITLKTIQNIINKVGIPVEHFIVDRGPSSSLVYTRVHLKGVESIGTNGKGTSVSNALASGYAEFIERVQNQVLLFDLKYLPPDAFSISVDSFLNDDHSFDLNILRENEYSILDELNSKNLIENGKISMYPFYSVKDKKICNFPLYPLIDFLKGSNGMAAGNTLEEAIVQGISEITERYALKKIISEQIVLPDIPKKVYEKSKKIIEMIDYYERRGYKLHIKDASLNGQLPVVATFLEDYENNVIVLYLGSHPSLLVSIERCLTELSQGWVNLESFNSECSFRYSAWGNYLTNEDMKYIDLNYLDELFYKMAPVIERNDFFVQLINGQKSLYEFSQDAWIVDNENYNNKDLLKWLYKKIEKVSNGEVYIRDVSFLGFPSVHIIIPSMSFFYTKGKEKYKKFLDIINLPKILKGELSLSEELTIKKLYEYIEYNRIYLHSLHSTQISKLPDQYLSFLCSILMNDIGRIKNHANLILHNYKFYKVMNKEGIQRVEIIKSYYELLEKKVSKQEIIKQLKEKYLKEEVEKALLFIDNLSFEVLKRIISKNAIKPFANAKIFDKFSVKLLDIYKQNCPNQMNLKKIFDFID